MKTKQLKLSLGDKLPLFFKSIFKSETPLLARLLILFTFAYVILPTDMLPEILGPLGLIDDALLIPLMANIVVNMLPKEMIQKEMEPKLVN
ncbi:DUF1232 domain-containing protein [Facklamia sp. DSM 111018]|uniref:DUF1232 domain-containing protein n=1 Tax=Facklamia lactis TaxID=2749967 RepID=A0ABS0LMP3_9LACT|nr:DUF1232 domain-containing protein [Facklamia lactis]MBG9979889.1 DUF1232 domain-containing protein [Facklamia lactis]MBG9985431.1 DUF1232 domain-containing protein [Facklamia lactis]